MVVFAEESCVRSCAALALELRGETCQWSSTSEGLSSVGDGFTRSKDRLPASRSLVPLPTPAMVEALRRPVNRISLPHSTLLKGLSFQMECQRPLHLHRRGGDVLVKVSH